MLRSLFIRDYALIKELDVEFDRGLNIITGETGAGKSIVVGAMKMILGERASTEVIRSGARKAVVEGVFDHIAEDRLADLLMENGIDPQPQLILRREITPVQSRAFINDSPATLQVMKSVVAYLVDLHGQHEHQSLLRTDTHIRLLDDVGNLGGLIEQYVGRFDELSALHRERAALISKEAELSRQKYLMEFQIEEIDRVNPVEGEEDALEAEQRIMENAEKLYETAGRLNENLYEADAAVYDILTRATEDLEVLAGIDEAFEDAYREIESTGIVVREVAQFLQHYQSKIEFNPARLEEVRERLGDLDQLKRKYGGSLDAVLDHRRDIGEAYELVRDFQGAIARLDDMTEVGRRRLGEVAAVLTERRRQVAREYEAHIVQELSSLGMPHARFEIRIDQREEPEGWAVVVRQDRGQGFQAFSDGIDEVEFFISTNPGEELRPLAKVASGGEISRIMLGLKTVLARSERLPILVFDEIDTGISGAMAQRVGVKMRDLAASHQIIAITHLPQIAAQGHAHYVVSKLVSDGRTRTSMRRIADDERPQEVATLMSGSDVSDAALESAREMIAGVAQ